MIPPDFIAQLLSRVDIVDVIDKHVKLKKAGQNYSACCPFHNEKTPSFSVSPTKQFYHCFGCGVSGSAIGFLMEYAGMGFRDAVGDLAAAVGMTMPIETSTEESRARAQASASLGEVMTAARDFYRAQLKITPRAVDYFKSRGLTGEIAAKFGLGYAPDDWQGLKGAVEDYTASALAECGLVIDSDEGRRYDRFRDRVMFPILDQRGNVIGFGGRVIGAGEPKYLNSPETPLFEKGRELYGLFQARRAIRDTETAIVVEGYMDVVALAQNGVENAVATLGTATTPYHVEKLLRMAENIVFCFDGDKAGQRAAWRALEQSLPVLIDGKDIRFLFLPEEDDPDTYVRRLGKDAFLEALKAAKPLSSVLFEHLALEVDIDSEEGRARLLANARPLIAQVSGTTAPALASMLRRRLAELVGLGAAEVERMIPFADQAANMPPATTRGKTYTPRPPADTYRDGSPKPTQRDFDKPWRKGPRREPSMMPSHRKVAPATLPVQLIARMLLRPKLAGRFDASVPNDDASELGTACRVATYIRDHDFEVTQAIVVEHFRDTLDAPAIQRAASHPLLIDLDSAKLDIDTEFDDALAALRVEAKKVATRAEMDARAKALGLS